MDSAAPWRGGAAVGAPLIHLLLLILGALGTAAWRGRLWALSRPRLLPARDVVFLLGREFAEILDVSGSWDPSAPSLEGFFTWAVMDLDAEKTRLLSGLDGGGDSSFSREERQEYQEYLVVIEQLRATVLAP